MKVIASSERLTVSERKDLGAFYTPAIMTNFCARWAIRSCHDTVLDPGCGDDAFLVSAAARLQHLGAAEPAVSSRIYGIDLNADALNTAKNILQKEGVAAPQLVLG